MPVLKDTIAPGIMTISRFDDHIRHTCFTRPLLFIEQYINYPIKETFQ
jgi:hypothetical protein